MDGDLVAHLRLAGDGLDDLAEDDADADAGAHGAEAAADAEGDRLAGVWPSSAAAKMRLRMQGVQHWDGLLWLVGLGDRAAEVDGGERGEDERLQRRHQADLEEVEERRRAAAGTRRAPASPSRTARPPDMNRMIRWPASMLAKRRTESEMIRMKFDSNSRTKMKPAIAAGARPRGSGS